ncbi:MAG: ribosome-associated translation inhibitor RaiA [candidate division WOR-3 bacterium]|nr:ribosome-associated translation inhibitor RaiA [candidate division WOR-3 bacterium]
MNFNITARHFELSSKVKDYVEKKLKKLEHYNHLITKVDIVLWDEANLKTAEGKISLRGNYIIAKTSSNDIMLAINLLADKLLKQIKTFDGKIKSKKRLSHQVKK